MLDSTKKYYVAHVKLPGVLPTETFVLNRLKNPYCKCPVPVLTMSVARNPDLQADFDLHQLADQNKFFQRFDAGLQNRLHWSLYFFQELKKIKPQLIHAHYSGAGEVCCWSARKLLIPLIVNFYGIETKYHIHDPYWLPRYQRLYREADAFICSSNDMRREMISSGCPEEKIYVVRCGIDTNLFNGEPTVWEAGEPLRLLSIARLHKEKGLNYLLEACFRLNQTGFTNWNLEIIGWGDEEASLRKQIASHSLENQVKLAGTLSPSQISHALRQAHLMILPSLKETQGVALQEAQATGTPVVTTSVGGIPEGVKHQETGIIVEPGNSKALFDAICSFIKNPDTLITMGRNARNYVVSNFSQLIEYDELAKVYAKFA